MNKFSSFSKTSKKQGQKNQFNIRSIPHSVTFAPFWIIFMSNIFVGPLQIYHCVVVLSLSVFLFLVSYIFSETEETTVNSGLLGAPEY